MAHTPESMAGPASAVVLHIPHAATVIPDYTGFKDLTLLEHEINLLTDWATDQIFRIEGVDSVIAKFSRVFCDVERLSDAAEPMFRKGRGICYTHTDAGRLLREVTPALKQDIILNYYDQHHQRLNALVEQKYDRAGFVNIIDCHSFSSIPLASEDNQSLARPDICLGTDAYHTPLPMIAQFTAFFEAHGLRVALNMPYAGTIVPLAMYQKNSQVRSIMIEINKRLYMDEATFAVDQGKVAILNNLLRQLFAVEI